MSPTTMQLRVLTATRVVLAAEVVKITAEGQDGSFTLLPRHVDMVSALVPGLLLVTRAVHDPSQPAGGEPEQEVLAVNSGVLVKCGRQVDVATRDAIRGDDATAMLAQIQRTFLEHDEREQRARAALARLEGDLTAQLIELEHG